MLTLPVYQTKERFGIASEVSIERALATGSTWGGRICEVIMSWLLKPTRTDALVREGGRLWANGARLYETWPIVPMLMVERPRGVKQLLECLGPLCVPIKHDAKGRKQIGKLKYREIDMAKIKHWAEGNDWATTETIDAALVPQGVN